jgi:hypothetical protein
MHDPSLSQRRPRLVCFVGTLSPSPHELLAHAAVAVEAILSSQKIATLNHQGNLVTRE